MKIYTVIFVAVFLVSCSDTPEPETKAKAAKPKADHLLKGYQDNLQKAKDMEKEVLKAAERQKKAIDDATK